MGNAYVDRGRLAPALILVALVALVVVALGMVAGPAKATSTFTTCAGCHSYTSSGDAFHSKPAHATSCTTCHVAGVGTPPVPSACASCHGKDSILAKPVHPATTCGVAGCHAVAPSPSPTATPTPSPTAPAVVTTRMTAKVAPTAVKVRKKATVRGTAGPAASLAGAKVAFKVERKVGTKWTKMKTGSTTVSATGKFKWTYKAKKKGSHRVTASIAKTSTHTAKKVVKRFRVK